eukprot:765232-Hanusia_phi.AAC.7
MFDRSTYSDNNEAPGLGEGQVNQPQHRGMLAPSCVFRVCSGQAPSVPELWSPALTFEAAGAVLGKAIPPSFPQALLHLVAVAPVQDAARGIRGIEEGDTEAHEERARCDHAEEEEGQPAIAHEVREN